MRPILRCALAAVFLAGCGAGPGAVTATPDRSARARVPAGAGQTLAAERQTAGGPVVTDAIINPVALTQGAPVANAETMPVAEPQTVEDLGPAFRLLRDGLRDKQGKRFELFDMGEVPPHATVVEDPTLRPDPGIGFSVQAAPETTQGKADKEAFAWAPDAKEIYVGWGYAGRWAPWSLFGQSRHVYYSVEKKRLLYLDYSFLRFTKARWESDDIILKFAGKYITWVLSEPRGRFPYNGRDAFNEARRYGYVYENRPRAVIKGICIAPLIIGPKWVFFDAIDRPTMIVDAADGEVKWDGLLLDILRLLFTFNP